MTIEMLQGRLIQTEEAVVQRAGSKKQYFLNALSLYVTMDTTIGYPELYDYMKQVTCGVTDIIRTCQVLK